MPKATYRHSVAVPLSAEDVWTLLQSPDTWANIGPVDKVWDAIHDDGTLQSFRWSTTVGHSRHDGSASAKIIEPGSKMQLALDTRELIGTLGAEVEPGENGSSLTVLLAIESRGLMASLFFPAISQAVGSGLPAQVDAFAGSLSD